MLYQKPHLQFEIDLWNRDYLVIGIDEVGRGAFAGPLVVGGVVFDEICEKEKIDEILHIGINDSKKLTNLSRQKLFNSIQKKSSFYTTSFISVPTINKIGIGEATIIGMRRVVQSCRKQFPDKKLFVLADAFHISYLRGVGNKNQKAIIHGDSISLSIAAASIIAKVTRDEYMKKLAFRYPNYGFEKHVGYGTKFHREAILTHGILPLHRKDFLRNLTTN